MFKIFSPYGFQTDYEPFAIVPRSRRGKVDAEWTKAASAAGVLSREFEEYPLEDNHALVWIAPVAEVERFSCFVAGTEIRMGDGSLRVIEDVQLGEEVVTHRGRVGRVVTTYKQPYTGKGVRVGICGMLDDVVCTANHPFYAIPREQVQCNIDKDKQCKPGTCQDIKLCKSRRCTRTHVSFEPVWTAAETLREGDYVMVPVPDRGVGSPTWKWSKAFARVLGYFLSEGSYTKGKRKNRVGLQFTFSKQEVTTLGADLIASVELLKKEHKGLRCRGPYCYPTTNTANYTVRGLQKFAEKVFSLVGEYSQHKCLQPGVYGQPPEVLAEFLATYIDGDGTCPTYQDPHGYVRENYTASTASRRLAQDIQWILGRLGSAASVCSVDSVLERRGLQHYHIDVSNTNGRFLEGRCGKYKERDPKQNKQHCFVWNGYVCRPVRQVEALQLDGPVYNIEVEGDHSYTVGNGIAVKNCNVNGDGFNKNACRLFHPTFLAGNAFTEHANKDPMQGYGKPVATAYNEKMGRVEILTDVDGTKNASVLADLEAGRPVDWSMACSLDPNAPILTESGLKLLRDIRIDDWVITHARVFQQVTGVMQRKYSGQAVSFRCEGIDYEFSFTADHPFRVQLHEGQEPVWLPAIKLFAGAQLVLAAGTEAPNDPIRTAPIVEWAVRPVQDVVVYNCSVGVDESYVVAGVVSHNCRIDYDVCSVPKCGNKATSPKGPGPQNDDPKHLATPKPGYCFVDDSVQVLTEHGDYRAMRDVLEGSYIATHTSGVGRVSNKWSRHYDGMVVGLDVVGCNTGIVTVTEEHPILAIRGTQVKQWRRQLEKVRSEHELQMGFIPAGELTENDYVCLPIPTATRRPDLPFDDVALPAFFAMFGWYLSEGSVTRSGGKNNHINGVVFAVGDDEVSGLLLEMRKWTEQLGIRATVSTHKTSQTYKGRKAAWTTIYVGSPLLGNLFALHGGCGARNKKLSREICAAPVALQRLMVETWTYGDGSLGKNKAVRCTTSSWQMASQMRLILARCGVPAGIIRYDRKSNIKQQTIFYLTISRNYANRSGLFQAWDIPPNTHQNTDRLFLWKGMIVSQVNRLTRRHFNGEVYNLDVDGDDSFCIPQCATHNCKHARNYLGAMLEDGHRVYVDNPHPHWFDISHVKTPAEVIARTMQFRKAASVYGRVPAGESGYDLAEAAGLEVPLYCKASLPAYLRTKYALAQKLAEMEKHVPAMTVQVRTLAAGAPKPSRKTREKLTAASKTAAATSLLASLRKHAVLLDLEDFATLTKQAAYVRGALPYVPRMFSWLSDREMLLNTANNGDYDRVEDTTSALAEKTAAELAPDLSLDIGRVRGRLITADPFVPAVKAAGALSEMPAAGVDRLLQTYAAYTLSELASVDSSVLNVRLPLTVLGRLVD